MECFEDRRRNQPGINQITRVGMDVCVSTFVVTLPSTTAAIPLLPCEAITIRAQPFSFAVATIASYG